MSLTDHVTTWFGSKPKPPVALRTQWLCGREYRLLEFKEEMGTSYGWVTDQGKLVSKKRATVESAVVAFGVWDREPTGGEGNG